MHEELSTPQQVWFQCSSDRLVIGDLAAQAVAQLNTLGSPATLLTADLTCRQQGYVVLQAASGVPPTFYPWLEQHPWIIDYAVHNVPAHFQTATEPWLADPVPVREEGALPAPVLPLGYVALDKPRPLLSSRDAYWLVWAQEQDQAPGLLIYQGKAGSVFGAVRAFFDAEEATTVLAALLERAAGDLLPRCSQEYQKRHAPGVGMIKLYLWACQLEFFRRVYEWSRQRLGATRSPEEEEQEETPASLRAFFARLDAFGLRMVFDEQGRYCHLAPMDQPEKPCVPGEGTHTW